MRKKLICYFSFAIIFIAIIIGLLLTKVFQFREQELIRDYLKANNKLIINIISKDKNIDIYGLKSKEIRVTYIDNKGNIIFDTEVNNKNLNNHFNREEIKLAREQGEGISIRYSKSIKKSMMYYATKLSNGNIVRSAILVDNFYLINSKFLNYCIFISAIIMFLSIWLSNKLSYIVVKPIKDLDFFTSRIAKGELNRRVNITTNDELGKLGQNFNYMAEKLQETINDSIDKQNRLEAILKCMDSGIIAVDRSFKVIMINPYVQRIFGINQNIVGKSLIDNIKDSQLEKLLISNDKEYREIKITWPQERDLRIKTTDIINRNEHIGTVAVVQDITDIKKLENMRSQFVANVSHELKTPLTSIKGFSETLREVDDPEIRDKFLSIINSEAERLTRLIDDILTLSRIEQQKRVKQEVIDVNKTLDDVYLLIKASADKKQIKLNLQNGKINNILGDEDKFKQMIINLVDNAIKYTESGGYVNIIPENYDKYFTIIIEDNGVGIPKEEIPRLFERFYRVDKARSRANGGTGLGLAIVKHIVILFNGEIEVKSILGEGSKFIIKIPYNYKK